MDKEVGITRAGYHKGMGITRRWGEDKEVGTVSQGLGTTRRWRGWTRRLVSQRAGYHKAMGVTRR